MCSSQIYPNLHQLNHECFSTKPSKFAACGKQYLLRTNQLERRFLRCDNITTKYLAYILTGFTQTKPRQILHNILWFVFKFQNLCSIVCQFFSIRFSPPKIVSYPSELDIQMLKIKHPVTTIQFWFVCPNDFSSGMVFNILLQTCIFMYYKLSLTLVSSPILGPK